MVDRTPLDRSGTCAIGVCAVRSSGCGRHSVLSLTSYIVVRHPSSRFNLDPIYEKIVGKFEKLVMKIVLYFPCESG